MTHPPGIEYLFRPLPPRLTVPENSDKPAKLSRRAFARRAAIAAASAVVAPRLMEGQQAPPPTASQPVTPEKKSPSAEEQKLSPQAAGEVQAKFDQIVRVYGARLTPGDKEEARRQLTDQAKALEAVRAFALDNSVQPATVLKITRKA